MYDVVVVGSGLVGSAFALALTQGAKTAGLKVALVDAAKAPPPLSPDQVPADALPTTPLSRVSAISPKSASFLASMNSPIEHTSVWERAMTPPNSSSTTASTSTSTSTNSTSSSSLVQSQKPSRVTSYSGMQVWDAGPGAWVSWDAQEDFNTAELGWIVENALLSNALWEGLQDASSSGKLDIIDSVVVEDVKNVKEESGPWPELVLGDGAVVSGRLVIGVDGARSRVRSAADLPSMSISHDSSAVVATVDLEHTTSTAWQRFLTSGPVALLPLSENYGSIVWSTSPQEADRLCSIPNEDFVAELNSAFRSSGSSFPGLPGLSTITAGLQTVLGSAADTVIAARSGRISRDSRGVDPLRVVVDSVAAQVGALAKSGLPTHPPPKLPPRVVDVASARVAFPLATHMSTAYVGPRVALMGDAAHTVHPLAGQGVNLGLGDALAMVQVLDSAVGAGEDIGSLPVLSRYESLRLGEASTMATSLVALLKLFGSDHPLVTAARTAGLSTFHHLYPARKAAGLFAMGGFDALTSWNPPPVDGRSSSPSQ